MILFSAVDNSSFIVPAGRLCVVRQLGVYHVMRCLIT